MCAKNAGKAIRGLRKDKLRSQTGNLIRRAKNDAARAAIQDAPVLLRKAYQHGGDIIDDGYGPIPPLPLDTFTRPWRCGVANQFCLLTSHSNRLPNSSKNLYLLITIFYRI